MWNEISLVHTQHVFTIECEWMHDERTYIHISTIKRVPLGIKNIFMFQVRGIRTPVRKACAHVGTWSAKEF